MPKKRNSVSYLKNKLDRIFSIYIRLRDDGTCITCGVKRPVKEMQAGHFIGRAVNFLRFSEENVNCQCATCNIFKHGNLYVYGLRLDQKYGEGTALRLHQESNRYHKFTVIELTSLIEEYTRKIADYEGHNLYDSNMRFMPDGKEPSKK